MVGLGDSTQMKEAQGSSRETSGQISGAISAPMTYLSITPNALVSQSHFPSLEEATFSLAVRKVGIPVTLEVGQKQKSSHSTS